MRVALLLLWVLMSSAYAQQYGIVQIGAGRGVKGIPPGAAGTMLISNGPAADATFQAQSSGVVVGGTANQVGNFRNLQVTYADTNTVTVTCDAIDVTNGVTMTMVTSVNVTASVAGSVGPGGPDESGLDTSSRWLYLHLICKDSGADEAVVFSNDATPILPTDYTHSRLVSILRNNSSGDLRVCSQTGSVQQVQETFGPLSSGSWATVDVSAAVPPGCRLVGMSAYIEGQSTDNQILLRQSAAVAVPADVRLWTNVNSANYGGASVGVQSLTDVQTFDYDLNGTTASAYFTVTSILLPL